MGGIAIVVSALVGYLVAHVRTEQIKFARAGITLMALDRRHGGRRASSTTTSACARGRNLGLRKRGKTGGQLIVAVGFALLALALGATSRRTCRSPARSTSTWRRGCGSSWPSLVVYGTTNAVNLTDGLDGLAAGSAAMVFAAFVDHRVLAVPPPGRLPRARRRRRSTSRSSPAAMFGACARVPLVERGARAGLHGRRRLARARRRDGRPRAAHQHHPAAADPRRPLRVRDAERHRAGDLVPRASTGGCCAWRRSTTTSRSVAGRSSR